MGNGIGFFINGTDEDVGVVDMTALADERGTKLKWIAQALRVALTGRTVSPGIDEVMVTIGKERVIRRLERAIAYSRRA